MTPSIRDVAKRAGVSIATVSRILNNTTTVNEKKVAAVKEAIEYYNYEPNQYGRGLVKQTSNMIGVYFHYSEAHMFDNIYNLELLKGMERVISKYNYSLVLINENEKYIRQNNAKPKFLEYINQKRIDGLLLSSLSTKLTDEAALKKLLDEKYPIVYIGKRFYANGYNVYAQYEVYMYRMMEKLYQKKHRNILVYVYYLHEENFKRVRERVDRFMPDMKIHTEILAVNFTQAIRDKVVNQIAKYVCKEGYSAICTGDMSLANLVLGGCKELNLAIPGDVSVISVEHKRGEGRLMFPAVDAFYVPTQDMGAAAAELLISCMREDAVFEVSKEFETEYIKRESLK
jgi:LacI family transcriptional regulator